MQGCLHNSFCFAATMRFTALALLPFLPIILALIRGPQHSLYHPPETLTFTAALDCNHSQRNRGSDTAAPIRVRTLSLAVHGWLDARVAPFALHQVKSYCIASSALVHCPTKSQHSQLPSQRAPHIPTHSRGGRILRQTLQASSVSARALSICVHATAFTLLATYKSAHLEVVFKLAL